MLLRQIPVNVRYVRLVFPLTDAIFNDTRGDIIAMDRR